MGKRTEAEMEQTMGMSRAMFDKISSDYDRIAKANLYSKDIDIADEATLLTAYGIIAEIRITDDWVLVYNAKTNEEIGRYLNIDKRLIDVLENVNDAVEWYRKERINGKEDA